MCDGEKVRHAWIYGGMCEIRPPVYKRADKGEEILGGRPLNKGVIQLLYAGTGRELRTFSGPDAASVSDHEESATPTVG